MDKDNDCRKLTVYICALKLDAQQPIVQINGYGFQRVVDSSKALTITMRSATSGLRATELSGCPSINMDLLKAPLRGFPGLQTVTVHDRFKFDLN